MLSFGFSAFLKLLALNDRPQRTAIRNRLRPSDDAYDFHRSMRLRAKRYLVDGVDLAEVLASCDEIATAPERRSARSALQKLSEWRAEHPGPIIAYPSRTFCSPNEVFKVQFTPDFGLKIDGVPTAIHIWNTARPPLMGRIVAMALSPFPDLYADLAAPPHDLAVLSLVGGPRLFSLKEYPDHPVFAESVMAGLERLIRDIRGDMDGPHLPPTAPQPPAL